MLTRRTVQNQMPELRNFLKKIPRAPSLSSRTYGESISKKQLADGRTIKQMKRYEGGPAEGDFPPNPIYGLLKQAVKKHLSGFEEAVERIVQDILDEEDR